MTSPVIQFKRGAFANLPGSQVVGEPGAALPLTNTIYTSVCRQKPPQTSSMVQVGIGVERMAPIL